MYNILLEIVGQLRVAINEVYEAQQEAERGQQWGLDDTHGKDTQIRMLANELDDAAHNFDRVKLSLSKLIDLIDDLVYAQEMAALSPSNKDKGK